MTKASSPYRLGEYLKVDKMNVIIVFATLVMVIIMVMQMGKKSPAVILEAIRVKKDQ